MKVQVEVIMNTKVSITSNQILNIIIDCVSSVNKKMTNVNSSTNLINNENLDSLSQIEILMEVEKRIKELTKNSTLVIPESILEQGSTVSSFANALKELLASKNIEVIEDQEGS
jgi:acyl carrier protein